MIKNKQINKYANKQIGTTIVELLIYIGLLSIFMLVLLDVFTSIFGAKIESQSTSVINQDARFIFSRLNYDITNASSFSVPSSASLVIGMNTYRWDGINLTLNSVKLNSLDTKIDNLSFTKIANTVKVNFTIESLVQTPSGAKTRTVESTFGTRP